LGVWSTNLSIPPGRGFFVKLSPSHAATNVTFVGNVIVAPGGGQTNIAINPGLELVGTPVPFSGNLNDAYGTNSLNIGAVLPNQSSVQVWNGVGFTVATKGLGVWNTNIAISVGEGFFINAKKATNWTQTLQ